MKKSLLLMLCSLAIGSSQAQVSITADKTGKIIQIKKSASYRVSIKNLSADKNTLAEDVEKNRVKLNKQEKLSYHFTDRESLVVTEVSAYNIKTPNTTYKIVAKDKTPEIEVLPAFKNDTFLTLNRPEANTTIKRSNAKIIAQVNYFNEKFDASVYPAWLKLQKLENDIFQLRDFIYNIQLAAINDHIDIDGETDKSISTALQKITVTLEDMQKGKDTELDRMNNWMRNTSALTGNTYTMNALGIVTHENLPTFADTAKLAEKIRTLTTKLNSDADYNYSALLMEQKRNNLQMQLEKIQAYHKQIVQSAGLKKQFAKFTIIGKYITTGSYNHYRFHDAAEELKLANDEEVKETVYKNKDKIAIYTYNIPPKGEVSYDMKSVGFVQELQFSRLAGGAIKNFNGVFDEKKLMASNFFNTGGKDITIKSYNDTLKKLAAYQEAIAIYTACIPPAEAIDFADDADMAYTTRVDELKELQEDSSHKNTYTLGLKVDGKETIKPKSFNFVTYKRSRIQFAAGVHFFSGNAPVVETEGTGFKTTSYNTPRYSAGLKVYLLPQTFADVNRHTWFKTTLRSWHLALLVDAAKPLENQYLGIGVDLMPGLGINAGPHFYRYTAYQLYNNAVVGEKKTLKIRDGVQVSLTMDGGLAKDIFTSFLKLF